MRRILALCVGCALFAGLAPLAAAQDLPGGELRVIRHISPAEMSKAGMKVRLPGRTEAVDPLAIYSDVTTFSGSGFAQGPSEVQTGNTITRMVMDDLTFTTNPGVGNVTTLRFAVANLNAAAVSVRARLRFWNADGAPLGAGLPNGPGTYYAPGGTAYGLTFNAFSFSPGVTLLSGDVSASPMAVPAGATTTLWAGITFDNNTGATGATQAQMDAFGQGIYTPVDLGSSTNTVFETTAAGSFFGTANPAGAAVNFGGTPLANMGWELVVSVLPVELQSFSVE